MSGQGGPGISRDHARELARRELARSIYQPSLVARWWHDITGWFSSVDGGLNVWGVLALAVIVLAAIAVTVAVLGPARTGRRLPGRAILGDRPRHAADYRAAAERLAAAGDYRAAIADRVRAIAADLEARGVLPPGPARTAVELARDAGRAFPPMADELTAAAHLFDEVRYGGRPGSERAYVRVKDLDVSLQAAAPATATQSAAARWSSTMAAPGTSGSSR
jgi:Domain of unknown function (DUF4129)